MESSDIQKEDNEEEKYLIEFNFTFYPKDKGNLEEIKEIFFKKVYLEPFSDLSQKLENANVPLKSKYTLEFEGDQYSEKLNDERSFSNAENKESVIFNVYIKVKEEGNGNYEVNGKIEIRAVEKNEDGPIIEIEEFSSKYFLNPDIKNSGFKKLRKGLSRYCAIHGNIKMTCEEEYIQRRKCSMSF